MDDEMCVRYVFLFKQKTAYEIQYGLVGSEMCIRDSLHISTEEKRRIEFIEVDNVVDILAILESDNTSKIIIVYNPNWFKEHPEYIMPFGYFCRERSKRKREVILLSRINDKVLDEIEPVADKMVYVQDIIETPNNRTCQSSQIALKALPEKN